MLAPTGFPSWSNYLQFTFAREFTSVDPNKRVSIPKSRLEKLGETLSRPLLQPVNFFLREIKNPLVILAFTISMIAVATLIFYPAQLTLALATVFPFLVKIQPWMVKLALFISVELMIGGVGLRALGRLSNQHLRHSWQARQIMPVHIGAKRL